MFNNFIISFISLIASFTLSKSVPCMKKHFYFLAFLLFFTMLAHAQRYLGVATGNWNAMNSMYINPANIAGSNERITINLFSFGLGVDNNLGTISSIGNIAKTANSSDSNATKNIFTYTNNGKFSMSVPVVDIHGPGILFSLNNTHTFAITTRIRAVNQFNNFDRSLYTTITQTESVQNGLAFNLQNFNWTAHIWSEIGFSYGVQAINTDAFQLKAGITLKYLGGIGYLGLKGKNLDLRYNGGDSLTTSNSDLEYASNIVSSQDAFTNGVNLSNIFGGHAGKGFGTDIGLSFVYKGSNNYSGSNSPYKAAFGIALTDLGSINYASSYHVNLTGNGTITGSGISQNVKDYNDFTSYALAHGYSADTGVGATKVYLPTTLNISADYRAWRRIYVNALFIANLANASNFGSVYYSQLTITPRYDSKVFSFGMPFTYSMLTHTMRIGTGFRISGLFFGSDDMMALFSNNQYGFNFYFGGMIPIYKKHHKNNDGYAN